MTATTTAPAEGDKAIAAEIARRLLAGTGLPPAAQDGLHGPTTAGVLHGMRSERQRAITVLTDCQGYHRNRRAEVEALIQAAAAAGNEAAANQLGLQRIVGEAIGQQLGVLIKLIQAPAGTCTQCQGRGFVASAIMLASGQPAPMACPGCSNQTTTNPSNGEARG